MAFAFVQCKNTVLAGCVTATPGTSLALTITPTLGNMLAGLVTWGSGSLTDFLSITDNGTGGTWKYKIQGANKDSVVDGTDVQSVAFVYGYGWSVVPTTVTLNTNNLSCLGIILAEFSHSSGNITTDLIDGSNAQGRLMSPGSTSADAINAGVSNLTPSQNNCLLVCVSDLMSDVGNGSSAFTAGTNYTKPVGGEHIVNQDIDIALEYWIQTTATANAGTWTAAQVGQDGNQFATMLMIFKPPSADTLTGAVMM